MNLGYALLPLVGWHAWICGGITIVRKWRSQIRSAMKKTIKLLKKGGNFYMSIEGRRSAQGKLQTYHKGAAIMAIKSHATIVPMIIHGAQEILPFGKWRIKPGKVEVIFCQAISTNLLNLEDRNKLTTQLRNIAEEELSNA